MDPDGSVASFSGAKHRTVANANGAYSGQQNTAINFSSSGSSDQDGAIVSYKGAKQQRPKH
ncbi:MAG: hypothetical protein JKX81_08120 [Arenicella sp.]|nr:hypothetical protein [Arenicella sp.]